MKRSVALCLCSLVLVAPPAASPVDAADPQRAPDGCRSAHAILGWSSFAQGKDESDADFETRKNMPWTKMSWVVGRLNWQSICRDAKPQLEVVGQHEPGKIQQASFQQYSVKGKEGALAYVAHCGHGGTCNMLAERFHRLYKGIGSPLVICGDNAVPPVLESPSAPSLKTPTCEELNEAAGDGGGADEPSVDDF
jgi:hypothetical protein